jgi:hypothetical protein
MCQADLLTWRIYLIGASLLLNRTSEQKTMKNSFDAYEGEWDFDGSCAPPETGGTARYGGQMTFTLGCFQWVRRGKDGNGVGLKKGKVTYRVKGSTSSPAEAYRKAREFCAKKNSQTPKAKLKSAKRDEVGAAK